MVKNNSILYRILLVAIAVLAIALRLYRVNAPLADWHSWRQADTAAVARNFLATGIDPLHPRYDDLSNIQSGKDNPEGWRMVEFPMYQIVGAGISHAVPGIPIEVSLRLIAIAASVGSVILLGLLVTRFIDPQTGLFSAFMYAILPYSIYYGRTILPDTFMVFWALLSLYCLTKMGTHAYPWLIAASAAAAIALLVKPMALFLLFPSWYILYRTTGLSKRFFLFSILYLLIGGLPVLWWRHWILQYPEGIAVSDWLLNKGNIRFKGAWFYWLFAKRLAELILGYWGLIPFGIGLVAARKKLEGWFSYIWLLGGIAYFAVFAAGNVQHDYYQILVIPLVALFVAKGFALFIREKIALNPMQSIPFSLCTLLLLLAFSWYTVRTYYWINRPDIIKAGESADTLLPKNAKVIAPYNGDTTFLYQTKRKGWPIGFDIDKKIQMGAQYYVTVSPHDSDTETRDLVKKYTVLVRNDTYAIIDLTKEQHQATKTSQ
ncbi:hypothetical protein A2Z00_02285 [Candidatus Gottesmanbacteria bacterium RBG_13_45_10]|uniref:Glycosyltransferase RgtA/B/C/D-like domain-containing protein n=1 Tax=Candidatus Gottesmanbacteria bacterium RBG_13_45_10 TaxID=1798370 RepID=A0A1F5ZFK7_9BACT|nr:MAG: hypothetical protein A2Z00_02285 [Candidatus Gottesmanbacteria bacterium RBG_13_45_10]